MLRYGAMFDEKGIGVAQTAAFGGLRLCVSGPVPRTSRKRLVAHTFLKKHGNDDSSVAFELSQERSACWSVCFSQSPFLPRTERSSSTATSADSV
jgi:hypothetical protein